MKFSFSKDARKDLARCLKRAGVSTDARAVVAEIEKVTRRYHRRFIREDDYPERMATGQATQLAELANATCDALEQVTRRTRKRLEDKRRGSEKELSLEEYQFAVDDIYQFALHAAGCGDQKIEEPETASDRALWRLTCDVASSWRKWTGTDLPELLPKLSESISWRELRALQQHPIWIVYNSLGIYLRRADTNCLTAQIRRKKTA
jgi:hypothetical protein